MGNRVAENIRRIVYDTLVKEWGGKDGKLSDLVNDKDAIPGQRGIGYQAASESTQGSGLSPLYNPLGTTQADTTNGSSDADSRYASVADIIDGASSLGGSLAESLLGLDGMTDPNTGDAISLSLTNQFDPVKEQYDDEGNYTPDWPDPEDPPDFDNWESGKEWFVNVVGYSTNPSFWTPTPQQQGSKGVAYLNDAMVGGASDWTFVNWSSQGATQWIANYTSPGTSQNAQVDHRSQSCTPGSGDSCPVAAPGPTAWPADDKVNFKREDGKFKTSGYDPEQTINHINDSSKVEFNFGSGRTGAIETFKDGGYGVYETGSIGGSATGNVQRYDSDGVFQGSFEAGEIGDYTPG